MKRRCVHVPGLFCFLNSAVPTENLDPKAACFVCFNIMHRLDNITQQSHKCM